METTGRTTKPYRLDEETAQALAALVYGATNTLTEPLLGNEKLIADIYTGRDPMGGAGHINLGSQGMSTGAFNDALTATSWRPPETTANLFLSRIRQIVSNLTPGVPTFRAKARVPGAAHLADKQNQVTKIMTDHGGLRQAMRKAAFIGMLSPYFGVKVTYDDKKKAAYERVKYSTVEPRDCGYEPFHRRFTWHAYDMQWGDLPKHWRPAETASPDPHDWEILRVTEVYHEEFGKSMAGTGCPMSIFVTRREDAREANNQLNARIGSEGTDRPLGEYVITETIPACPLVISNFLDPAPGEDVPAAEVLSWIPLMRMIVQTLVQIDREVRTSNNTILYDKNAISEDAIDAVRTVAPGGTVFIGVDADDALRGVNATMRPVEQSTVLNEYLAALSTYMRLFDDVTGVSPSDRGVASNPRKSATESAAITDASSKRNQDRLEIMAAMWTKIAQIGFKYQRKIFGKTVDVPLANGVIRTLPVPDPVTACFSFDVDPVELGHLSNSGDIQALMQWLTVTTNAQQAFQGGIPRMTREALRRLGNAMGIEDADTFLDAPTIESGPEERYIRHLQTQEPIMVFEDDQHDMYMSYYSKMQEAAMGRGADEFQLMALRQASDMHSLYAARRSDVINPGQMGQIVPGVGAGPGEVDNNLQSALAVNAVPQAVPQGGMENPGY
jgi:hypothetical protein